MRTAAPTLISAELPDDGLAVPAWAYRSEAFAEDIDERTLPGMPSPRRVAGRTRKAPIWPWAVGVPALVVAIGLVAALHG